MASVCESFSPLTVGAYRIRPDVGERGMMVASILSFFREHSYCLACSLPWRAYAIRPYIFTICLLGDAVMGGIVRVSFSPPIVGAYCIHPDMSEREMMAASIPLLFREHFLCLACSLMWRAYSIRPYIFTICSLVMR